jgi:hypothetical protein
MIVEKKEHYIHLQKYYRGYFLEEFKEDYISFRSVIRIINSYFKNPSFNKTHAIYNKLVLLHRVFDKKFINTELINKCDDKIKQSFLKYFLNEIFHNRYNVDFFEEDWEKDIEQLKTSNIICKL